MSSLPGGLPEVGDLLADKYRLVGILGRGGMGVVFDAHHELLERRVAVKVLAPEVSASTEAVTRFMNEARAAARIASDRVVAVIDVGSLPNGLPYMVMERLEGRDLGELDLTQAAPVPYVIDLMVEAIEGVSHAHLEGIIHRDLKPSNLFVARTQDGNNVVKVLDFGISKLTALGATGGSLGSMTATNAVLGTPLYMSPEQLRSSKAIDVRADVWSLGVITYELLTRHVPFTADNMVDLFASIQETDPRPLTALRGDIPPALSMAVLRSLRRLPAERYGSAFEFGKALEPFGSTSAQAAMQRLEARMAAKGVAPRSLPPRDPSLGSGGSTQRIATPSASANMAAAAAVSAAPPPRAGGSTAAPWSVTGGESPRASIPSRRGALVLVPFALVAVSAAAGGAFFLHRSGSTGGSTSATSASSPVATSATASVSSPSASSEATGAVKTAPSGSAAVEAPVQAAPSASPPPAAAASAAPRKDPPRLKMPSSPTSAAPASPHPSSPSPPANPMSMKPF